MDAITAAVALMSEQVAVERLNTNAALVKQSMEADNGLMDLINSTAQAGLQYGGSGTVSSVPAGQVLNASA